MSFSKRIKKLASLVDSNAFVIDVGCDHALLDIYLTLNNNNKCLATDINENALLSAKENVKRYNVDVDIKQSDGLNNIDVPSNSTCVIAGMGTNLILDILSNNQIDKIDNFIIQTNKDYEVLRKAMVKKGFYITDEIAFLDKNIWYVIMKFKRGMIKYSKNEYLFGPILLKKKDADTYNYFKKEYDKYFKILSSIPKRYALKRINIKCTLKHLNNYIKKVGPSL